MFGFLHNVFFKNFLDFLNLFSFPPPDPPGVLEGRDPQTCTFEGPDASNTTKIPREDPQREKKTPFEPHTSPHAAGPHAAGLYPSAPTLEALTFSRSGLPPLWAPTLRAEALRATTFSGFGPPRSSFYYISHLFFFCAFFIVVVSCHFLNFSLFVFFRIFVNVLTS